MNSADLRAALLEALRLARERRVTGLAAVIPNTGIITHYFGTPAEAPIWAMRPL